MGEGGNLRQPPRFGFNCGLRQLLDGRSSKVVDRRLCACPTEFTLNDCAARLERNRLEPVRGVP
jgi:hypothetical protein